MLAGLEPPQPLQTSFLQSAVQPDPRLALLISPHHQHLRLTLVDRQRRDFRKFRGILSTLGGNPARQSDTACATVHRPFSGTSMRRARMLVWKKIKKKEMSSML